MNRFILCDLLMLPLAVGSSFATVRGNKAMFIGGTIQNIEKGKKAQFDLSGPTYLRFRTKKDVLLEVPFAKVSTVEYGQHAGRRVRAALLGGGIPALFSHKRKHFITIYFLDDQEKEQAAIFELSKKIVRETLTILRVKTGKAVEFQSEDAKHNLGHP